MAWIYFVHNFGLVNLFMIFFVVMNVYTFSLYGIDKNKAIQGDHRISEKSLLIATFFFGGIGAALAMTVFRHKTRNRKFKVWRAIGVIIAIMPLIHVAEGLTLGRIIQFVEKDFHAPNWPEELNGYRIAFMTDLHSISDEDMAEVVAELNERSLDLVVLGGDFADYNRTAPHYQGTIRELSRLNAVDGIFGVEGNHDYYRSLFAAMEQYGIIPLDNSGLQIRDGFYLAGVEDLWNRNPNVAQAISGAAPDDFILLLTHNPDVSMQQSTEGIGLILAGHNHGGQIAIFGFPIILLLGLTSDYGIRFAHGFNYSADGVPVFTSRGSGPYYNNPRIFARPEVVIFTMWNE